LKIPVNDHVHDDLLQSLRRRGLPAREPTVPQPALTAARLLLLWRQGGDKRCVGARHAELGGTAR
jgi:hypothetical protein